MTNFEKRHLIEALRSGIPSWSVGKYFSSSRKEMICSIQSSMNNAKNGSSESIVLTGKYGEGKTHMLNTISALAQENNMAVSMISLGKETPMNRPECIFSKLIKSTILPHSVGKDVLSLFYSLSSGSDKAADMYLFSSRRLKTDRLYFVLRALLESSGSDADDIDILEADLMGSYASQAAIKKIYQKYACEKAQISGTFSAKNNTIDYLSFYSHLFKVMGCSGWVILFDEAELIGRFGRKTRESAYLVMKDYLFPPRTLENTLSVFAFSTSFMDEVIAGKNEYSSVALGSRTDEEKNNIRAVLDAITSAKELRPLTESELTESIITIIEVYQEAYGKLDNYDLSTLVSIAMQSGFLLRTKIRTVIEALDQLYQYHSVSEIKSESLMKEDLSLLEE